MTDNLAAALAAVQANLPQIVKGETATVPTKAGGKYSYSYADLADVSQVILPLLGKNGLSWITRPTVNDGGKFVLAYELLHTSGESRTGEFPLQGGTPQEIGSAITYARRYTLCAVTGVAPAADDDDGAAATQRAQRERPEPWSESRPVPFRAEPRTDPEQARQNILANARKAIAAAPWGGLPAIEERIEQYVERGVINPDDVLGLRQSVEARRAEIERNRAASAVEDRTAEQPEQPVMDADWPEPARPGGGDPN